MSWSITWEPHAVAAASRFLNDDPEGLKQVLAATDYLLSDPRPDGSTPYGSSDVRRIRIGWYRVVYEIDDTAATIHIIHFGRVE
ncbi:MAG: plasmid stabilization protein [Catenulispora sp. 13_1_20CM_3_70_7]|jgi:mRNA interferase RelE/StbE|nr:type II toxin-antitoxin system RelE/ParE family toxin [Catenulisporales bacterium]OLE20138.1 MAG: plasmid stabilization protein [Catenulispora sp. 13_1_20CM_3_70_7]